MKWIPIPAAVLTLVLTAMPALAQNASTAPPPKDALAKPWASLVLMFFLVVFIAVPSFMSSKRGHQD